MMGAVTVEPDDAPPHTRLGVLERGSVDDVSLDADGADAELVVLFRAHDRPGPPFRMALGLEVESCDDGGVVGGCWTSTAGSAEGALGAPGREGLSMRTWSSMGRGASHDAAVCPYQPDGSADA